MNLSDCIILGSGRSGTSMVAGCLARAGYFMGEALLRPRPSNPKGFFEAEEINDVNEEILARVLPSGIAAYGNFFEPRRAGERPRWLASLPGGVSITSTPQIIRRIRSATEHRPFCYKDPRFCYTLPVWQPFLADAALVCTFRHPALSAASIVRECTETVGLRSLAMSYERALEIWYRMYSHVLEHCRAGGKWLFLHFDQILRGNGLDRLAEITGAEPDRSFPDSMLVRTEIRQQVQPTHLELYRKLCRLAQHEESSLPRATCITSRSGSALRPIMVAHSARRGGAQNVLHDLAKGLSGDDIHPLVVFPQPGPMEEALRQSNIETEIIESQWCVTHHGNSKAEQYLLYISGLKERVYRLVHLIRQRRTNLMITNTAVVLEGALAARLAGIPHIWYVHELLSRDPGLTTLIPLAAFNSLFELLTDKIIAVSESVRSEIGQFIATDKIEVIYTGLDRAMPEHSQNLRQSLFGWDESARIVAFVGARSERKGIQSLVDAAPEIIARCPYVKFVLAGDETNYGRAVRRRIHETDLDKYFRIFGFRDDALDIIANSDVLVLPSLADPLPLAVIEAMHLGKPVVATRSGGAAECVVDGVTGTLVAVHDTSALAEALTALLQSPGMRQRFGQQARLRAHEMFGYAQYLERWRRVLSDAADSQHMHLRVPGPALVEGTLGLIEDWARDKQTVMDQEGIIETMAKRIDETMAKRIEELNLHRRRADLLQEHLDWIRRRPLYKVYRALRRGPALHPNKIEESRLRWIPSDGGTG